MTLESGRYYWMRHISSVKEKWQPVYIGEDSNGKQWIHVIDVEPIPMARIMRDKFEFAPLDPPEDRAIMVDALKQYAYDGNWDYDNEKWQGDFSGPELARNALASVHGYDDEDGKP